jgi:hypothetical protein
VSHSSLLFDIFNGKVSDLSVRILIVVCICVKGSKSIEFRFTLNRLKDMFEDMETGCKW